MIIHPFSLAKTLWVSQTPNERVFTISSIALFILSPTSTLLAVIGGLSLRLCFSSKTKLEKTERIIPASHTLFVLIGAVTAAVKLTPLGKTASLFIGAIPFLCSLSLGNVCWRIFRALAVREQAFP